MDGEPVEKYAKRRLNELFHMGTTLDTEGMQESCRMEGERRALEKVLELLGEEYEHDRETCWECRKMEEIMEGWD